MNRYQFFGVGVALLIPGIVSGHPEGHWQQSLERRQEQRVEHHQRKAEQHFEMAREHMREADRSARQVRRDNVRQIPYGRVISVQPIHPVRAGSRASESCVQWNENYNPRHSAWAPAVVGGVLGGALGYRLGEDHGDPEVATIAGGLLGAAAGHGIGRHVYDSRHIRVAAACRPPGQAQRGTGPVEYLVTYRYNGRIYREHMDYDPGEWVRLNVEASPA
jgi:uncharacterized protein YcfJ